jgi:hypothetical protein
MSQRNPLVEVGAQQLLGPFEVPIVVTRHTERRLTTAEMPRTRVVHAVRSFTKSLILLRPVSLASVIFRVSTGGCRVLTRYTNAAGLSIDSKKARPA